MARLWTDRLLRTLKLVEALSTHALRSDDCALIRRVAELSHRTLLVCTRAGMNRREVVCTPQTMLEARVLCGEVERLAARCGVEPRERA